MIVPHRQGGNTRESGHVDADRTFARQPIFDRDKKLHGYELLFRSGPENAFQGDPDRATRTMLDNFLLYGADAMTGASRAFINCTREALVDNLVSVLPKQSVVLEVLETIDPDPEVVAACQSLKKAGHKISLDDFVPRDGMRPLVELADYIKVDFQICDAECRRKLREYIRGTKALLVAEKVEDEASFQAALAEGHDLFQGYFFARPTVVTTRAFCGDALQYLHLVTTLYAVPFDWDRVEKAVKACPSLTYRLLRLINSGLYLVRQEITSIKMALVMLGEDRFRKLATIAACPDLDKNGTSDLLLLALQRAVFCELLAPHLQQPPAEQFLFGLLSLFPLLLGVSTEQLVAMASLRRPVQAALLGEGNEVSRSLRILEHYEMGQWAECAAAMAQLEMEEDALSGIYLRSLQQARELLHG